jgi:signal transduction histidine kinase
LAALPEGNLVAKKVERHNRSQSETQWDQLLEPLEFASALKPALHGWAHDENNRMSALEGTLRMLREQEAISRNPAILKIVEQSEGLTRALSSGLRLVYFLSGGSRAYNADKSLNAAIDAYRSTARRMGIAVERNIPENLPPLSSRIASLVMVLLDNALIATALAHRSEVSVSAKLAGKSMQIRVSDQGEGISPELAAEIWTPLFTTWSMHRGLGLAVALSVTQELNGTITFERNAAGGADFVVILPVNREVKRRAAGP